MQRHPPAVIHSRRTNSNAGTIPNKGPRRIEPKKSGLPTHSSLFCSKPERFVLPTQITRQPMSTKPHRREATTWNGAKNGSKRAQKERGRRRAERTRRGEPARSQSEVSRGLPRIHRKCGAHQISLKRCTSSLSHSLFIFPPSLSLLPLSLPPTSLSVFHPTSPHPSLSCFPIYLPLLLPPPSFLSLP